jgi:hypothetical protein
VADNLEAHPRACDRPTAVGEPMQAEQQYSLNIFRAPQKRLLSFICVYSLIQSGNAAILLAKNF